MDKKYQYHLRFIFVKLDMYYLSFYLLRSYGRIILVVEIRKPIQIEDAVQRVMKYAKLGEKETVSFDDCENRRLAEPIVAKHNIPSFDKSPYDGFALRASDTTYASPDNPQELEVVEHIGAGDLATKQLEEGQATRIMTGAQIPEGATCVAMFEVCQSYKKEDKDYIAITNTFEEGQNIITEGSEVKLGDQLIEAGTVINPGVKALLATFGYAEVKVAKKPVVGVIATGTELLDIHEPLEPGKIRNSNAYMICSQINRAGGKAKYLGKLVDELEPSFEKISHSLEEVDMLITTGGVSVGDFDLIPAILEKLNANVLFNKIAMRPGSVTTVALANDKFIFGLSGNPSACYVGFELFTRPIINALLFSKNPYQRRIKAKLGEDFPKFNPFTRFVRSYVTYENANVVVKLAGMDKSNVVSSLANTNCLMQLPGETSGYQSGDEVEVILLEDTEGQEKF